jgi:tetratricopeptide (TPR) repeat protein
VNGDLGRTRTNGAGRFTFFGLSTGRFRLKVITAGTNFLEEEQDVEIQGTGGRESRETQFVNFYLKLDPRKADIGPAGPPEAVFIQDVPEAAKKLFKSAQSNKSREEGLKQLETAIEVFPNYFDALLAAGKQYVDAGQYVKGAKFLIRAVEVNTRSYVAYTTLAYAAYKLNKVPEALLAAKSAYALEPKAVNVRLLLARLLRIDKSYKDAESLLLDTQKLAPSLPKIHYELALVYNRQDRNMEAANELAIYIKYVTDPTEKKDIEDLITKLKTNGQE